MAGGIKSILKRANASKMGSYNLSKSKDGYRARKSTVKHTYAHPGKSIKLRSK